VAEGIGIRKVGDWARVAAIVRNMRNKYEASVRRAMLREAHYLRGKMIEGIAQQAPAGQPFAPLSPMTLAMRQARGFAGSKALIVTGALRRSITVVHVGGGDLGGAVFVGVHRQTKGPGGKSMVNIAEIHEFGRSWTQPLSAKARRYLFAVMKKAGLLMGPRMKGGGYYSSGSSSKVSINIPARPFVRPVIDKYGKPDDVKRRFVGNVLQGMGGDFKLIGGGIAAPSSM
jgi:hypothetical protein